MKIGQLERGFSSFLKLENFFWISIVILDFLFLITPKHQFLGKQSFCLSIFSYSTFFLNLCHRNTLSKWLMTLWINHPIRLTTIHSWKKPMLSNLSDHRLYVQSEEYLLQCDDWICKNCTYSSYKPIYTEVSASANNGWELYCCVIIAALSCKAINPTKQVPESGPALL